MRKKDERTRDEETENGSRACGQCRESRAKWTVIRPMLVAPILKTSGNSLTNSITSKTKKRERGRTRARASYVETPVRGTRLAGKEQRGSEMNAGKWNFKAGRVERSRDRDDSFCTDGKYFLISFLPRTVRSRRSTIVKETGKTGKPFQIKF